jgi:hypothetical protein
MCIDPNDEMFGPDEDAVEKEQILGGDMPYADAELLSMHNWTESECEELAELGFPVPGI